MHFNTSLRHRDITSLLLYVDFRPELQRSTSPFVKVRDASLSRHGTFLHSSEILDRNVWLTGVALDVIS